MVAIDPTWINTCCAFEGWSWKPHFQHGGQRRRLESCHGSQESHVAVDHCQVANYGKIMHLSGTLFANSIWGYARIVLRPHCVFRCLAPMSGQPGPCSAVLRDLKHQEPSKTVEQLAAPDPAAKFQHHQLKYFTWDPKNCRQHDQDMIQDNCRKARGWKVFRIQGHPRPLFQSWLKQCHDFKTWACASFAKNHWTEIRDCDRTDYQGFNQPKWGREIGAVIGNQPCSYAFSTHYMLCMPL